MTMSQPGHLRFPGVTLRSSEDFQRFEAESRALLEERRRQETLLADAGRLVMEGTCGVCLSVTRFTSKSATSHGGYLRDQQLCGCEHRLAGHKRALLHLAATSFGGAGWFRLGLFGRDEALLRALAGILPPAWIWSGVGTPRAEAPGVGTPDETAPDASTHMVLSADTLAAVAAPDAALARIARALMPGGLFIFTIPFDPQILSSQDRSPHRFGWDILDRVREAGFQDCTAHCYWSVELGLLGPDGMIFKAFR
jgi:hypothetical protein